MKFWFGGFAALLGLSIIAMASDEVNFPADWGELSKQGISETSCPSLDGFFAELAWTYQIVDGAEDTNYSGDDDSFHILRNNQTRFKKIGLSSDDYKNSFLIKQKNETSFILTRYDKHYWNDVVSTEVSKSEDGLTCNKGWWAITKDDTGNKAAEGGAYRMQFDRQFTRLDNKDLVVHARYVYDTTNWFILKQTRVEDTFYRYRFIHD